MYSIEESQNYPHSLPAASKLARISFFAYLCFIFFGTSMPFQEAAFRPDEIVTSNPINQFGFSLLYLLSFTSLLYRKEDFLQFVKEEKFLNLFLAWTLLSVFWADFPFVSLKRWIQLAGMAVIFLAASLDLESENDALYYLRIILGLYIPLTFLSILFIPGAIQWEFPAWRGLAAHKNTLGQISLVSLLVWSFALRETDQRKRNIAILFWILSLILLLGSRSTTSLLAGALVLTLWGIQKVESVLIAPLIGKVLGKMLRFLFFAFLLLILLLTPDILANFTGAFGKDTSFTGRADLWAAIWEECKKHLLIGCGYGGFWVATGTVIDSLYEEFQWLPNQSHLGYLDILNETGIIGLTLVFFMVFSYFRRTGQLDRPTCYGWFIITALILNLQESTLFGMNTVTGALFTFSYIALFSKAVRKQLWLNP